MAEVLIQLHPPQRASRRLINVSGDQSWCYTATAASCPSSTKSYTSRSPGIALPMCTVRIMSLQYPSRITPKLGATNPGHAATPIAPHWPPSCRSSSRPSRQPHRILQRSGHLTRSARLPIRQHPLKQLTPHPRRRPNLCDLLRFFHLPHTRDQRPQGHKHPPPCPRTGCAARIA